jgi:TetR/AcrR family transcriptional repressor of nem operon
MRYPQGRKAETRARILGAAGAAFRARGFAAVGVDEVMSEAGLTAGAFYKHFSSKEDLLAASLGASGAASRQGLLAGLDEVQGPALLRAVAGRYLSRTHRDAAALGCPLPALSSEVARSGAGPRGQVQEYLEALLREVSGRVPPAPGLLPEDRVLATAAVLVGGLLLSRAVPDDALSERILRAARRLAVPELAAEAGGGARSQTQASAPPRQETQQQPPAKARKRQQPARTAARRSTSASKRSSR